MIIDGRQVQCRTPMFAALLYVDDVAMFAHHTQRLHFVHFSGQMYGSLFLIVKYAGIDRTAIMKNIFLLFIRKCQKDLRECN